MAGAAGILSATKPGEAEGSTQQARQQEDAQQAREESPPREPMMRPRTPDGAVDNSVSPCSLSANECPSSSLEQDALYEGVKGAIAGRVQRAHAAPADTATSRHDVQVSEAATANGHHSAASHSNGEGPQEFRPSEHTTAQSSQARGKLADGGLTAKENNAQLLQNVRNTSADSLSESDASNGTFIDKAGQEDESDHSHPVAQQYANNGNAGGVHDAHANGHHSCSAGEDGAARDRVDPLQPPPSVFSAAAEAVPEHPGASEAGEDGLHCGTCKVTATSEEQLAIHLEGKKHKRHLAISELKHTDSGTAEVEGAAPEAESDLHCNLCDVTAPTIHHREYHLRGQKHQRREKQHQLMEASAEIASSSVNALLSDDEEYKPPLQEAAPAAVSSCVELEAEKPLRSPFEAFDTSRPQAPPFPPANLHHRMSSKMVRFSGNLESFSEEPTEDVQRDGVVHRPLDTGLSTGSYRLVSGGSFSSPAAHFCPVCGIIATSKANLEDHMRGRRHARRLQYLSHMPAEEREDALQRMASGSGLFRQASNGSLLRFGSLVLPSSMDLRHYIEEVAQIDPQVRPPPAAVIERAAPQTLNKALSSQQLSWDSTKGLHLHMEQPTDAPEDEGSAAAAAIAELGHEGGEPLEREHAEDKAPKPQPRCEICGITTTSQAHMEAHMAGRKHRRRVEAAAGRSTIKQSPHYCTLCDISTTSQAHLALHLVGRAHRRRQKAIEEGEFPLPQQAQFGGDDDVEELGESTELRRRSGEETSGSLDEGQLGCRLCGFLAASADEFEAHMHSPEHRRREQERGGPTGGAPQQPGAHKQSPYASGELRPQALSSYGNPRLQQRQMHRGSPSPGPRPMPMGMYPYATPFFPAPAGHMMQFMPGAAPGPMYGWWPAPPHQVQHMGFPKPPYQQAHPMPQQAHPMPMAPPFPGPQNPFSAPMQRGHLPPASGGYMRPRGSPPMHGSGPRGIPMGPPQMQSAGSGGWMVPQQGTYNCEVCNVHTDQLDYLKQHLRGRQHMRRLHNPPSERKE